MPIILDLDPPTEPDHERAVEAAVIDALRRRLKSAIELMVCQRHGRAPTVTVRGRVEARFDFHVTGCCADFVRTVKWRLEEI